LLAKTQLQFLELVSRLALPLQLALALQLVLALPLLLALQFLLDLHWMLVMHPLEEQCCPLVASAYWLSEQQPAHLKQHQSVQRKVPKGRRLLEPVL